MKEYVTPDNDGQGFTKAFIGEEVEFADPIKYYSDWNIRKNISLERSLLHLNNSFLASFISEEFYVKRAKEEWDKRYEEIIKTQVPENFLLLFKAGSKKEQERLLKGQSLTPMQLIALIFKAWSDYGFTFSSYTAEYLAKDVDESKLPNLIHVEDGKVKVSGKSSMSEGQLKNVVNQRKVTVSKFLDKGDEWHCFFVTYRSLRGEESWKNGQPHFHYISDKWSISRKDAVEQFKSEKYPSTSIHIDLLDY